MLRWHYEKPERTQRGIDRPQFGMRGEEHDPQVTAKRSLAAEMRLRDVVLQTVQGGARPR